MDTYSKQALRQKFLDKLNGKWLSGIRLAKRLKIEPITLTNVGSIRDVLTSLRESGEIERMGIGKYFYRLREDSPKSDDRRSEPKETLIRALEDGEWASTQELAQRLDIPAHRLATNTTTYRRVLDEMIKTGEVETTKEVREIKGLNKIVRSFRLAKVKVIMANPEIKETIKTAKVYDYLAENSLMEAINQFLAEKKRQMKNDIETIESERNYYKALAERYKETIDNNERKQFIKF